MAFNEMLQILITANGSQAVREFAKVGTAAKTNLGAAEKASGGFAGAFKRNAGLIVGGAVAIGAGLKVSIDAYEEQRLAELKLQNSLKNNPRLAGESADAFLKQASALQQVTVAGDEQIIGAQAMLATFRLTGDEVRSLTPLVVDYARKFDTDLVSAAKQVGKAMDGQVGALKRNGVTIDEQLFKTDKYAAVMQALRGQVGGFAREEGKTLTGQLMILKNQFGEMAETVGSVAVPAVMALVKAFNALDVAGGNAGAGGAALGAVIGTVLLPGLGTLAGAYAGSKMPGDWSEPTIKAQKAMAGFNPLALTTVALQKKAADGNLELGNSFVQSAEDARKQEEAIKGVIDSLFGLIDAELKSESADLRVASAAQKYADVLADSESTMLDGAEALNAYKSAIVASAKAAGDAASEALGPQATAQEKATASTQAQIAKLSELARTAAPQAKAAISDYIVNALGQIPPSKMTQVWADTTFATAALEALIAKYNGRSIGMFGTVTAAGVAASRGYVPDGRGGYRPRAAGGPVSAGGAYLVGERGPELLQMGSMGGHIVPNHALGGGSVVVNITAPTGADRAAIGREISEYLDTYRRRAGLN